jgi:hypothetical protein
MAPPPIPLNTNDPQGMTEAAPSAAAMGDASPIRNRTLTPQPPMGGMGSPVSSTPHSLYQNYSPVESSDMLVPPGAANRFPAYVDSPLSSRRSSWSVDHGGDPRYAPISYPFDDSRATSRAASPSPMMEPLNMQTITEKYNIYPSSNLLLYPNDKEADDDLHDPTTGMENDNNIWTKRGLINIGGLGLITLGILILFIGYPILYVFSLELRLCILAQRSLSAPVRVELLLEMP